MQRPKTKLLEPKKLEKIKKCYGDDSSVVDFLGQYMVPWGKLLVAQCEQDPAECRVVVDSVGDLGFDRLIVIGTYCDSVTVGIGTRTKEALKGKLGEPYRFFLMRRGDVFAEGITY